MVNPALSKWLRKSRRGARKLMWIEFSARLALSNDIIYHTFMDTAARLLGSGIAAAGTLFQLAIIAATVPQWPECSYGLCVGGHPSFLPSVNSWHPFIDNDADGSAPAGRRPRCPAPRGRDGRHDLAAAPLPDDYDPYAYEERAVYACVLVARDGGVLAVRMLRGTGEAARDFSLVRTIRRSWRFGPEHEDPSLLSWQRVRLNSGPGGGTIYDPPVLE